MASTYIQERDGAQTGVLWAAQCPGTAPFTTRPCSPAGDVAHHGDAELVVQVDAIGDAGGNDDLGENDWSEAGPSCAGTVVEEEEEGTTNALELHLPRNPIPPLPTLKGTGIRQGFLAASLQEAGAALGTVISSMGMGMGNLAANLWLSSFTIKMATMAMMAVTRVPTLVSGSFLQRSMTV